MPSVSNTLSFGKLYDAEPGKRGARFSMKTIGGMETEEILTSLKKAQEIPLEKQKEKVEKATYKRAAMEKYQGLLLRFQTVAKALSGASMGSSLSRETDVFNDRAIQATTNSSTITYDKIMNISVSGTPAMASRMIEVESLARADRVHSTLTFSDTTTITLDAAYGAPVTAGNLRVNGIDIAITGSMTMADLVSAINNETSQTEVIAVTRKITATDYRLELIAQETGTPISFAGSTFTTAELGMAASGETATTLSAKLYVDNSNVPVYRTSNTITDVVDGLTLTLMAPSVTAFNTGTRVNLEIGPNPETIKQAIRDLAETYNDIQRFYREQTYMNPDKSAAGKPLSKDAYLYDNNFLRSSVSSLKNLLFGRSLGATQVAPGDPVLDEPLLNFLSEVGFEMVQEAAADSNDQTEDSSFLSTMTIKVMRDGEEVEETITVRNIVKINEEKLNKAVDANLENLKTLLMKRISSTDGNFVGTGFPDALDSSIAGQNVTLTLSRAMDGTYSAQFQIGMTTYPATVDTSNFDVTGVANGVFEKVRIHYGGPTLLPGGSASTTLNLTQGVASLLQQTIKDYMKPGDDTAQNPAGSYEQAIRSIVQDYDRGTERIKVIEKGVEKKMETHRKKFDAYERVYAESQTILNKVQALYQAMFIDH